LDTLELQSVTSLGDANNKVAIAEYVEFFVNGTPLSDQINEIIKPKNPVLSNYTSVLGTMELTNFDRLKIQQLLSKKVGPKKLEELFPAEHFDQKVIADELSLDKVLIYCCAECGDYKCGGFFVKISETPDTISWSLNHSGKNMEFTFDRSEYQAELNGYLSELE
jgi:hypothetical protein